jgi:nucleoside-triphosphatase
LDAACRDREPHATSAVPVLLLTGRPGVGKTTVLQQTVAALGNRAGGFYTREVRVGRRRTGFELVTLSGETALLATVEREVALARPHSFGRYRVDLATIDEVGVPALLDALAQGQVVVVDEIGPMEILSPRFQEAILQLLDGEASVIGTVVQRPQPFADRVKAHPRVRVRTVTTQNRDELPGQLLSGLGSLRAQETAAPGREKDGL